MKTLESITIQDMLDRIFVNFNIQKRRKELVDFYIQDFGINLFGDVEGNISITANDIGKKIDNVLSEDRKSTNPFLVYNTKKRTYQKAKNKGTGILPSCIPDSNYTGKGGECLVMGELLFNGYNVNNMMVDEGIDIVASKDNVFYYIQVKTRNMVETNKFLFQVKWERYNKFIGTQMRYILVARCRMSGQERTVFFKFTNNDIDRFLFNHCIPQPSSNSSNLSIKIEYDNRTGKAYMYDGRVREDVSFNMNNFTL